MNFGLDDDDRKSTCQECGYADGNHEPCCPLAPEVEDEDDET